MFQINRRQGFEQTLEDIRRQGKKSAHWRQYKNQQIVSTRTISGYINRKQPESYIQSPEDNLVQGRVQHALAQEH